MPEPPSACWTIDTLEACAVRETVAAKSAGCVAARRAHAAMARGFRARADEVANATVREADPDVRSARPPEPAPGAARPGPP